MPYLKTIRSVRQSKSNSCITYSLHDLKFEISKVSLHLQKIFHIRESELAFKIRLCISRTIKAAFPCKNPWHIEITP